MGGNLLIAGNGSNQIYQGQVSLPDYIEDELKIAEGGQVYVFDDRGRHLRTQHALTGATLYEFGYDAEGLLAPTDTGSRRCSNVVFHSTQYGRDILGNELESLPPGERRRQFEIALREIKGL